MAPHNLKQRWFEVTIHCVIPRLTTSLNNPWLLTSPHFLIHRRNKRLCVSFPVSFVDFFCGFAKVRRGQLMILAVMTRMLVCFLLSHRSVDLLCVPAPPCPERPLCAPLPWPACDLLKFKVWRIPRHALHKVSWFVLPKSRSGQCLPCPGGLVGLLPTRRTERSASRPTRPFPTTTTTTNY